MPAYGVKYRIEIGCVTGTSGSYETYRVDIEQSGYASSITDLKSSSNPIQVNYPGGQSDYAPIKPSEVILEVLHESGTDLSEFIDYDEQEYRVAIYNNDTDLRWVGWLTTEYGYYEDWSTPLPRLIQLRAVDGFGFWKNKEFRESNGDLRTGRATAKEIIQEGLAEIYPDTTAGYFLTYVDQRNDEFSGSDWTTTTPTNNENPLVQTYIDQENYMLDSETPMMWWDVISDIVGSQTAQLTNGFHKHGWPSVITFPRYQTSTAGESLKLLKYESITSSYDSIETEDFTTAINSDSNVKTRFQGNKQFSDGIHLKYITMNLPQARPLNFATGGTFEDKYWTDSSTLNVEYWPTENSITYEKQSETTDWSDFSIKITTSTSDKATAGYVLNKGRHNLSGDPYTKMGIQFDYYLDVSSSSPSTSLIDNPAVGIAIWCSGQYLQDWNGGYSWEATENIIWHDVSGDNMDTWVTVDMGRIAVPEGGGEIGINIYEPYEGDYTVNSLKYDNINILEFDVNDKCTYEDVIIEAENTAANGEGRVEMDLMLYDYPNVSYDDLTTGVKCKTIIDFEGAMSEVPEWTNGDYVRFQLDGVYHNFTYESSPSAAKEFSSLEEFRDEIYGQSNNYVVTILSDVQVQIESIDFEKGSFGTSVTGDPSGHWSFTDTTKVDLSADITFKSKAAPSADSGGTSPTTRDWYRNGETESYALHELIMFRHFQMRSGNNERLSGRLLAFNDSDDQFGMITGYIGDSGENAYLPVQGSCNVKMLEWDVDMVKINSNSPTLTFTEK